MTAKRISVSDFIDAGRKVVLDALDEFVTDQLAHDEARGWTDYELPVLFSGLDAHLRAVAERINEGNEPGSANLFIEM